jgi:predicted nucleic acid-binding protein
VIHLDTDVLIDSLSGALRSAGDLRSAIEQGEQILISTIVLYEWLRGPRQRQELEVQEALFPRAAAVPFASEEAALAAELYQRLRRPRGREIDIAVAACAIAHGAALWTLNRRDFEDVPGLQLYAPA